MKGIHRETCTHCNGTDSIMQQYPEYGFVTHDMASDAGEPSMEGERIVMGMNTFEEKCENCNGEGIIEIIQEPDRESNYPN